MGEIKDAQRTEGVLTKTHIGGQALIEGVMMRGRFNWAVAVRQPDGTIYTESHDLASGRTHNRWMYWPVIRGCTALVESLALGYKALDIAVNHAYDFDDEEEMAREAAASPLLDDGPIELSSAPAAESASSAPQAPASSDAAVPAPSVQDPTAPASLACATVPASISSEPVGDTDGEDDESALPKGLISVSMIIGMVLGIALFIVLPAFVTNLIMGDYGVHTFAWNLVDGLLRVAIFIAYIWAISRMKDIKRMFAYHGAEHKTIHCYEHGLPLTPKNAQSFPRLHVRCGTAFLIMTMIIAILVFTIVPVNAIIVAMGVTSGAAKLALVILSRIVLAPLVAGLSYELTVKWAGSRPENPLVKVVLWPGMQMQRLTTNQPDDGMLECAIAAMGIVIEREREEAEAGNEAATMPLSPCEAADAG